jgi:hypothetical protein
MVKGTPKKAPTTTRAERVAARKDARKASRVAARRADNTGTSSSAGTPSSGSTTPTQAGGTTSSTPTPASQGTGVNGVGEPMNTSASTTAPYTTQDTAADESDQNMEAFFSTGSGAAEHYDVSTASSTITGQEGQP